MALTPGALDATRTVLWDELQVVLGVVLLAMGVSSAGGDQSRCRNSGAKGMAILESSGVCAFLTGTPGEMKLAARCCGRKGELADVKR